MEQTELVRMMAQTAAAIAAEERSVVAQVLRRKDEEVEPVQVSANALKVAAETLPHVPTMWVAAISRYAWQQRQELRAEAAMWLTGPMPAHHLNAPLFEETARTAYALAQLTACAQGIEVWREATAQADTPLANILPPDLVPAADIEEAAGSRYLLLCSETAQRWVNDQGSARRLLEMTARYGIAAPCLAAALAEYDALRRA